MSSSPISPGLQQIIDNQSLLLPQGFNFNLNNVIEGIENNTYNNKTSLAADKAIVDMELDNFSHHVVDSTFMASTNDNQNNSYIIMNNDKALSNVSQSQHTKTFQDPILSMFSDEFTNYWLTNNYCRINYKRK